MAKRDCYLHIDLTGRDTGDLTRRLLDLREPLKAQGFKVPTKTEQQPEFAAIELTRSHKTHGLKRAAVEGAWSYLARHAYKGRKIPLLSVPGFGACTAEQVDLLFDSLGGMRIYVIASVLPGELESPEVVERLSWWRKQLKRDRLFAIEVNPERPGAWDQFWDEYAALAGVDLAALPREATAA